MNDKNETKSNINLIGEIPIDWVIGKVKYFYNLQTGFTPDTKNEEYYDNESGETWVTIADITNSGKYISDSSNKISQLYIQQKKPMFTPKGSLLYSFKLTVGKRSFAEKDLYTNEAIASFIDTPKSNLNFLYYSSTLIENNAAINIYNAKLLNQELIKNAYIVLPPKDEQILIANFLDEKCSNIDSIISDLENQISILEKYKKSIITEVVTKGLDSNIEFRESNVKWIGRIPKSWVITRFQDIAFFKKGPFGSSLTISMFVDNAEDTVKVYEQKNAIGKDFNLGEYYITSSYFNTLKNFEVYPGDVIVSCAGTIGECYIMPETMEKGIINQALMRVKFNNNISKEYYLYIFDFLITEQSATDSNGSAMKNIPPLNILKKYKVPLPSLEEQIEISNFLDKKCTEIESIIEDKNNQIETIKKYKNSLIYEYVTGKKRVSQGDVNE